MCIFFFQQNVCASAPTSQPCIYPPRVIVLIYSALLITHHFYYRTYMYILRYTPGNIITVEVNMARLVNYNVKIKKMMEAAALSAGGGGSAISTTASISAGGAS